MEEFINSLTDCERFRFESIVQLALREYLQHEKKSLAYHEERLRNAEDFDTVCKRYYSFYWSTENIRLVEDYLSRH